MLGGLGSRLFPNECPGCGAPAEPVCPACASGLREAPRLPPPPGIDRVAAAFAYEGVAREVVARVKYRGRRAAVGWLAAAVADLVRDEPVDLVTWVPTTNARRRERGFDHAELLARAVAALVSRPARRLLARGPGPSQTGLRAADRRRGPELAARRGLPGARVLLVDDVATTGASLAAAAVALRRAGARSVVAAVAARTPRYPMLERVQPSDRDWRSPV